MMRRLRVCGYTNRPLFKPAIRRPFAQLRDIQDEGYDISPLVLELDAVDNTNVQKYEDLSSKKKESHLYGRKRFYASQYQLHLPRNKHVQVDKSSELVKTNVKTSIDIMRYILYGQFNPRKPLPKHLKTWIPRPIEKYYGQLGVELGSPFRGDLSRLLRDFETYKKESNELIRTIQLNPQAILVEIMGCTSFSVLRQKIYLLAESGDGCRFLVLHGMHISSAIYKSRKLEGHRLKSVEMSSFFLRLISMMATKEISPGTYICINGLDMAVSSHSVPAVRKYLEIAHQNQYKPSYRVRHAIRLLHHLIDPCKASQRTTLGWRDMSEVRKDIKNLLSGWDSVEAASRGDVRQPCFATLLGQQEEFGFEYLHALARIGASDMIWYEWTLRDTKVDPQARSAQHKWKQERAKQYIVALLICHEVARAKEILFTEPELASRFISSSTLDVSTVVGNVLKPDDKNLIELFRDELN
ncbi:hypothetical protein PVAG01_04226 [Phlyctema vagabunda]|uniref:ATPase expression protein 2, mitochondrial n=1 Tax=Phlyctema vagabunda TaxID=108571 RepID=A0ABR4PNL2_9HELO